MNWLHGFRKYFFLPASLLAFGAGSLTAQKNGDVSQLTANQISDSLLRSYSVDELLKYKRFYQEERDRLESERAVLRRKGISELEAFVESQSESNVLDKVLFRLAELHYEDAAENYMQAQEAYGQTLDSLDAAGVSFTPPEPKRDYTKPLALYSRIIEEFPASQLIDDSQYNIAFLTEEAGQKQDALALYEDFLNRQSGSPYVPDVLMRQAEYWFNPPQSDLEKSVAIYERILEYKESPKYNEALYRLGWAYYKLNNFSEAIRYFTLLADDVTRAEEIDPNNKFTNPNLREESIEYIGVSFLDHSGVEGAEAFLSALGGRGYGIEILRKIGDAYMEVKEEHEKAVAAYKLLLKLYPYAPDAPVIQAKIAESYRYLEDDEQTYLVRKELFRKYNEGSEWWVRVEDEDARTKGRGLAEHALRSNINMLLDVAEQIDDRELFGQAVSDTREYLRAFPEDTSAAKLHWNMALTLDAKLERSSQAYDEYIAISNQYWDSDYQLESAKNAVALAQDLVSQASGDLGVRDVAELAETVRGRDTTSVDLNPQPEDLTASEKKLVEAIDNFIKLFPQDVETPARLAQAGSIYYNKNNFRNALKYFKTVLKHFQNDSLAADAEYLVMESYFGSRDFESVEIVSKRLREKDYSPELSGKAKKRLAEAIYLQAEALAEEDKHFKAAEEYIRVAEEVADAEFADLALFNAGLAFDRGKEYKRAIETYERLSKEYAASKYYLMSLNNMAIDYGELKDFSNAANIFERLGEEDPDSTKGEAHLYNASVFYAKAESWGRAIRVNHKFVDRYPGSEDADDLFYDVANYHLKLNELEEANRVYDDYARKFPDSPRTVETFYRRGEYYESIRRIPEAKTEYEKAVAKSDAFLKEGKDGNKFFAAEALFHLTELKLKSYEDIRFELPASTLQASKDQKKTMLVELVDSYAKVAKYGTIKLYESTYKIGYAYEQFAETWAKQEIGGMADAQRIVARKEINETASSLYERAFDAYRNSIDILQTLSKKYQTAAAKVKEESADDKIQFADTTLVVADRWIKRSKEKVSETIYDVAELGSSSVESLLQAPVPASLNRSKKLTFRGALLEKYISPLVDEIVAAHTRNLKESGDLGLDNQWVEASKTRIVTTRQLLADEYLKLAQDAENDFENSFVQLPKMLVENDAEAQALAGEMKKWLDASTNFSAAALKSFRTTLATAAENRIENKALKIARDEAIKFVENATANTDSLRKVAQSHHAGFDRKSKEDGDPVFENAKFTFEDFMFALADKNKALLKQGYQFCLDFKYDNSRVDKLTAALVKSDPEAHVGLLGLTLQDYRIVSDLTWTTTTVEQNGWTLPGFAAANWKKPDILETARSFAAYRAEKIWLYEDVDATDSTQVDSSDVLTKIGAVSNAKRAKKAFFRKTIDVKGLPVSGQIQISADDGYQFYINGELISTHGSPAKGAKPQVYDFSEFLRSGKNILALRVEDGDGSGGGLEALVFLKHIPDWDSRATKPEHKGVLLNNDSQK